MRENVTIEKEKLGAFELLIEECKKARREYERAEVAYLEFLEGIEARRESVWRAACATFTEFLLEYVGKPEPRRYQNFKAAREELGIKEVRAIGLDAAILAMRVEEPQRRDYLDAANAFVAEKGVQPSAQHARQLRQQVAPVQVTPLPLKRQRELEALRVENETLRAENKALREENDRLRLASGSVAADAAPSDSQQVAGRSERRKGGARKASPKASDSRVA